MSADQDVARFRAKWMPLYAQLYLIAHDDQTGEPHLSPPQLSLGLAGAVLIQLALDWRVAVGWEYDHEENVWRAKPGRLTPLAPRPRDGSAVPAVAAHGNPVCRTGLVQLVQAGLDGEPVDMRDWLRAFATHAYDLVHSHLVNDEILVRDSRRRLVVGRTDFTRPAEDAYFILPKSLVVDAASHYTGTPSRHASRSPNDRCAALAGLLHALDLAPYLYHPVHNSIMADALERVMLEHHETDKQLRGVIQTVVGEVKRCRGDLALAAMA